VNIGIIGAGSLGSRLARAFASAGISALIANSRGPKSLVGLVKELGPAITAATTAQAADAEMVFLALRWADLSKVLGGLHDWKGRVVVDASNPIEWIEPDSPDANDPSNPFAALGLRAVNLRGRQSTSVVRDLVPGARVVKAFNHLNVSLLDQPITSGGQRVLFDSGDDADAKQTVRGVIEKIGFFPVDLGTLEVGGPLVSLFGPLSNVDLVKI
jgi:8-hydroxy-5-deazaflavin:NADPH oxidoreductase